MRLKPVSCLALVRQLKQTVKAKADGKSKENEIKEIPGIRVCTCFTVGFNQRTRSKTIRGFSPID